MFKFLYQKISTWLVIILLTAVFLVGTIIGVNLQPGQTVIKGADLSLKENPSQEAGSVNNKNGAVPDYLTKDVNFNLFWDVWNLVKSEYYEKNIPETQLFYGALSGIIDSLDDPYSVFMTPVSTQEFESDIEGKFEGIGAEIGIKSNRLTIISPLESSPAEEAGLRAGDIIGAIDGKDTSDITLFEAVSQIRGPKGTPVVLTILRSGESELRDITVVRDTINVKSLVVEIIDGNLAHIKVRQFNDDTIPLLSKAVLEISQQDIEGVILDLRNNPGGYLQSAIDMSAEWVNGEVVVLEKMRDGNVIEHRGLRPARLANYPTVVLVNEGSASGSEIVAGALKDWDKATIVGMTTFGKGSVQNLSYLRDGSSIKLTIAQWFTPKGVSIAEGGIEPDVMVELTEEDYDNNLDPQLDTAIEILRQK